MRFGVCWDDLEWWEQQDVLTRMWDSRAPDGLEIVTLDAECA